MASHIPPFNYGASAIILDPAQHHEFAQLRDDLIRDTRPVNYAEQYLVDQILHAQWELRRANNAACHSAAADPATLAAVSARATRNLDRAQKALARIQSSRLSHNYCYFPKDKMPPPAADLTRIPRRKTDMDDPINGSTRTDCSVFLVLKSELRKENTKTTNRKEAA